MFLKHNAVPSRFLSSVLIETQLELDIPTATVVADILPVTGDIASIPSTSKRGEPKCDRENIIAPKRPRVSTERRKSTAVNKSILQEIGVITRVNELSP